MIEDSSVDYTIVRGFEKQRNMAETTAMVRKYWEGLHGKINNLNIEIYNKYAVSSDIMFLCYEVEV